MINQRIGIFGGSFNPVHNGHIHICKAFLNSKLIDELWIIPVFDPPHKVLEHLVSFEHRLEMTKIAFSNLENVRVIGVESELPKPNYTLKTVEYLQNEFPDKIFLLCIGGDSLNYFDTWYEYEDLLNKVQLLVVKRENVSYDGVKDLILNRSVFIRSDVTNESSSEIRKELELTGKTNQIPVEVLNYILKNKLYTSTSN